MPFQARETAQHDTVDPVSRPLGQTPNPLCIPRPLAHVVVLEIEDVVGAVGVGVVLAKVPPVRTLAAVLVG
eukprot:7390577-Prymnesium_polylepis.1